MPESLRFVMVLFNLNQIKQIQISSVSCSSGSISVTTENIFIKSDIKIYCSCYELPFTACLTYIFYAYAQEDSGTWRNSSSLDCKCIISRLHYQDNTIFIFNLLIELDPFKEHWIYGSSRHRFRHCSSKLWESISFTDLYFFKIPNWQNLLVWDTGQVLVCSQFIP